LEPRFRFGEVSIRREAFRIDIVPKNGGGFADY
jgi:hypothetical protein